jgi:ribosomal protein S27E
MESPQALLGLRSDGKVIDIIQYFGGYYAVRVKCANCFKNEIDGIPVISYSDKQIKCKHCGEHKARVWEIY